MIIQRNTENLSGTTERFFTVPAGIQCKLLTSVPVEWPPTGYIWVYVREGLWRALDEFGVELALGGEAGPPGPPGEEAFRNIELAFTYESDFSTTLIAVSVGIRIKTITIAVDVAFDDADTFLSVGHTGNMDGLMARTDNDPTAIGQYEVEPNFLYGGDDTITFYINSYASTQGSGSVFLELVQN